MSTPAPRRSHLPTGEGNRPTMLYPDFYAYSPLSSAICKTVPVLVLEGKCDNSLPRSKSMSDQIMSSQSWMSVDSNSIMSSM